MSETILEIAGNNRHLCLSRGFLVVKQEGEELGKVPFDNIYAILITGFAVSYSNNLLMRVCEESIPFIICGKNFHPAGILLAPYNNYKITERTNWQISASLPLKKQLWQQIVSQKILNQAFILEAVGAKFNDIKALSFNVKSGDTENYEAQAARIYFPRLFGRGFLRNQDDGGINAFLNYGYSVIRAAVARSIVAYGLNPSLGVFHKNKLNAFCLTDDVMEPFRPVVDALVISLAKQLDEKGGLKEITPKHKQALIEVLEKQIILDDKARNLKTAIAECVLSLAKSYEAKRASFYFPKINFKQLIK